MSGIMTAADLPPPTGQVAPDDAALLAHIAAIRGATVTEMPDGGAMLDIADPDDMGAFGEPALRDLPHDVNLAEHMADTDLRRVGMEVAEGIEADLDTCQPYLDQMQAGLKLLGLRPERMTAPFDGASSAVHPLLLIALVRFVANARAELLPAAGPVKVRTQATPEAAVRQTAQRKERWLNHFLTTVDQGYYRDCDAGHLWLGLYGSIFRKVFDDPVSGRPSSRYLTPLQLLVSWHAPDLESAQRVTHLDTISYAEARRRQLSGYYIDGVRLDGMPYEDDPGQIARIENENRQQSGRDEDAEQQHAHCHCLLDLPGQEHLGGDGVPTGLPLPYLVTIDRSNDMVLRIERDWEEGDPLYRRRQTYAHFLMHPGLGFYGWGLIVLLSSSTETASTLLRQAINAFMLHSFPGGFRVKGMRPETETLAVGPGEFPEVDSGGLPIQSAIMPLPYRDVPGSFPALFEIVAGAGQTLGGTQELQVGEGRQDAPVGTTLAMLEAAIRPTAAVFKRLQEAQGHELRMLAKRFAKAGGVYPYLVDGQRGQAMAADFADVDDVIPVTDPNMPTQTQRIALAQGTLQLAQASDGVMDVRAAYEDMLLIMGRSPQEVARLMPPPSQGQPADVATEFGLALKAMPLTVGPGQDHAAHIITHISQMQTPGLPPQVSGALMAHIGEHVALWYRLQMQNAALQAGIPMPPLGQPIPPEMETAVAQVVAGVSGTLTEQLGQLLAGMGGDASRAAELALKRDELAFKAGDAERKARQAARQDQGEMIQKQMELQDNAAERAEAAADRAARLREAEMTVKADLAKAIMTAARGAPLRLRPAGEFRG